jgi:amidohydrolase
MSNPAQLLKMASALGTRLTRIRRDIHSHPELAFNEKRTARCVAEMLRAADVEVRTGVGRTGVVGLLRVKGARRTVALRADMDALPLQEANAVPYRSRNAGVMHACGHDGHTAMLLGAAFMLSRMRRELPGNVKFLFQPAEEIVSGAPGMVKDGALASPKVDAIFAAHVSTDRPFGTIALREGPGMAGADHFRIVVTGRGGHASHPDRTRDPLVPANQIYQQLAGVRRMADPFQPCVISICSFESGVSYNVIPHSVEMRGTLRTFQPKTRARVMERMARVVRQTAAAHSVEGRIFWDISCPVLVNAAAAVGIVKAAAAALGRRVVKDKMTMGSEDFSFYLERVPGAFFSIGTRRGRKVRGHHSNRFDFDERILPIGAAMLAQCALTFLAIK